MIGVKFHAIIIFINVHVLVINFPNLMKQVKIWCLLLGTMFVEHVLVGLLTCKKNIFVPYENVVMIKTCSNFL